MERLPTEGKKYNDLIGWLRCGLCVGSNDSYLQLKKKKFEEVKVRIDFNQEYSFTGKIYKINCRSNNTYEITNAELNIPYTKEKIDFFFKRLCDYDSLVLSI
jgi:hypothetical protein